MKAGKSSDIVAVLPSRMTNSLAASNVSSLVAMPRINSTSCMRGTGFMKWMPMNRSGWAVTEARRVIEIEDVFDATIASGLRKERSAVKILRLTSSFSEAASTTRSQSPSLSKVGATLMRSRIALRSASSICPLATWRDKMTVDGRESGVDALLGDIVERDVSPA